MWAFKVPPSEVVQFSNDSYVFFSINFFFFAFLKTTFFLLSFLSKMNKINLATKKLNYLPNL